MNNVPINGLTGKTIDRAEYTEDYAGDPAVLIMFTDGTFLGVYEVSQTGKIEYLIGDTNDTDSSLL